VILHPRADATYLGKTKKQKKAVYVYRNQTNIDLWVGHWAKSDTAAAGWTDHHYPWHKGSAFANFVDFFGPSVKDWLLPFPAANRDVPFPHVVTPAEYDLLRRPVGAI
jgi:hypothetical protein